MEGILAEKATHVKTRFVAFSPYRKTVLCKKRFLTPFCYPDRLRSRKGVRNRFPRGEYPREDWTKKREAVAGIAMVAVR